MIASLRGTVAFIDGSTIVLDVGGVGYKVLVAQDILSSLSRGSELELFTYLHVRENILELFGFRAYADLKLFEQLISVSGIGPKTAIGVFALGTSREIVQAIVQENIAFFTAVPRLGKKNIQKLIIELKTKMITGSESMLSSGDGLISAEAAAALQVVGFSASEAGKALLAIQGQGETVGEKVKFALRYLGKKS